MSGGAEPRHILLIALLAMLCVGCGGREEEPDWKGEPEVYEAPPEEAEPQPCGTCLESAQARRGGWCDEHKTGWFGALSTRCRDSFFCMRLPQGGWCEGCKTGYLGGQDTQCESCFLAMTRETGGWCDRCNVGYAVGRKTRCMYCVKTAQAGKGTACRKHGG